MLNTIFKEVINSSEKSKIAETILRDLPEWFGLEESTLEYIENVRHTLMYVVEVNGNPSGFISLKPTSVDTVEIYCIGIKKEFHNQGLGTKLYHYCEVKLEDEYEYIQVKTVDEGNYKEYDATVGFYKSLGFKKLEVFQDLWDAHNPCLLLVKKL